MLLIFVRYCCRSAFDENVGQYFLEFNVMWIAFHDILILLNLIHFLFLGYNNRCVHFLYSSLEDGEVLMFKSYINYINVL